MPSLDLSQMSVEWQNFFLNLFNRVGGVTAPSNSDLVEKSGSITQIEIRSHSDLQDLDVGNPHPQYVLSATNLPIYAGSGVFAGTAGVYVAIGSTLSGTSYRVSIQPIGSSLTRVGVIGVINKTVDGFTVTNSGSNSSASFDWILVDAN